MMTERQIRIAQAAKRDIRIALAQGAEAKIKQRMICAVIKILNDCRIDEDTSASELRRIAAQVVDAINLVDKE